MFRQYEELSKLRKENEELKKKIKELTSKKPYVRAIIRRGLPIYYADGVYAGTYVELAEVSTDDGVFKTVIVKTPGKDYKRIGLFAYEEDPFWFRGRDIAILRITSSGDYVAPYDADKDELYDRLRYYESLIDRMKSDVSRLRSELRRKDDELTVLKAEYAKVVSDYSELRSRVKDIPHIHELAKQNYQLRNQLELSDSLLGLAVQNTEKVKSIVDSELKRKEELYSKTPEQIIQEKLDSLPSAVKKLILEEAHAKAKTAEGS